MSTAVAAVRVHPDKYEKEFDTIVAVVTQYINKRAPTLSLKVASVGQTRPAKWQKTSTRHGTFKGKIELKKHSKKEYDPMSSEQHQQLHELQKNTRLIMVRRPQKAAEH